MSFFGSKPSKRPEPNPFVDMLRTAARSRLRTTYTEGLEDGLRMALDHIQNVPDAGGIGYDGPLPAELDAWIGRVRERLDEGSGRPRG